MGVSAGRIIQGEFIVMFYGPTLISLLFLEGLSAGGAYLRGRCDGFLRYFTHVKVQCLPGA